MQPAAFDGQQAALILASRASSRHGDTIEDR